MKLSTERVKHIADSLVSRLQTEEVLELIGTRQAVVEALDHAITEELSVEDRLNTEIRTLMKAYSVEIERGNVDYQKMFTMIKKKLVQERGLIL